MSKKALLSPIFQWHRFPSFHVYYYFYCYYYYCCCCILFQDSLTFCKTCYLVRFYIFFQDSLTFCKTSYPNLSCILFQNSLAFCKTLYLNKFHIIPRSSYDTSLRNHNLRCVTTSPAPHDCASAIYVIRCSKKSDCMVLRYSPMFNFSQGQ